jgi:hypothetical protein
MGNNDDDMSHSDCSSSNSSSSSSSSSSRREEEEQEWDDWVDEGGEGGGGQLSLPTRCLLSDEVLPGVEAAMACDREQGLDLLGLVSSHGLGLYGAIKLINYIRSMVVRDGLPTEAVLAAVHDRDALAAVVGESGEEKEEDEEGEGDGGRYLRPVLEDDPFLFGLGELLEAHGLALAEGADYDEENEATQGEGAQVQKGEGEEGDADALGRLRAENGALREEVVALRARVQRAGQLMAAMDEDVKVPKLKKPVRGGLDGCMHACNWG